MEDELEIPEVVDGAGLKETTLTMQNVVGARNGIGFLTNTTRSIPEPVFRTKTDAGVVTRFAPILEDVRVERAVGIDTEGAAGLGFSMLGVA